MSFPNIPDIKPSIHITLEDSINLLLTSIALEEISLSKLIDAERRKILFVLDESKQKATAVQDAKDINKSVDTIIKDLIKFQMLLQFKLEDVINILPSTTTTTTSTTTTTTTTHTKTCTKTTTTKCTSSTTTCTTTSTYSTCSTTTKKKNVCSLIGKGIGCVSNKCDGFYCNKAEFKSFVISWDSENRFLRYNVHNDIHTLSLKASAFDIKTKCPSHEYPDNIVIYGRGYVSKKSKCGSDIVGTANFILIFWNNLNCAPEFKMKILSHYHPEFNHNSGIIKIKNLDSVPFVGFNSTLNIY